MRRTIAITLMGAICLLLFAGCQATPKKPAVAGKDLEQMLALATSEQEIAGSLEERLDVPKRYESQVEDTKGKFKITIDADIILPKTDRIPLVRVEGRPFDQQTVDKAIAALFDDGKLYETESLNRQTKSEISEMLIELKQKKIELEQQGLKLSYPSSSEDDEEPIEENHGDSSMDVAATEMNQLDMVMETIKLLEEEQKRAPIEKELVESTGALKAQDITAGMPEEEKKEYKGKLFEIADVGQLNPAGGMRSIFVVNNEKSNHYSMEYNNRRDFEKGFGSYFAEDMWRNEMTFGGGPAMADSLSFPAMTIEQAQDIAEDFLEKIGIDYLVCERWDKVIGGSNTEYAGGIPMGNLIKAYRLQYVRQVEGVPVTYTNIETTSGDGDRIFRNWDYESMTLIVDDSGIVGVSWNAPYNLMDTITDNTTMLPFSRIRDVFEKMIIISNSYYTEGLGADMNIIEVRLGLMRIFEHNKLTTGLLIPVWDFFGTLTTYYEDDEGQRRSFTHGDTGQTWLTINAIDGTIIDRSIGY